MLERFRSDIESQHAPQRLVEETIEKLHKVKKTRNAAVYVLPGAVIMAAALFFGIFLNVPGGRMNYTEVEYQIFRTNADEEDISTQRIELSEGTILIKSSAVCEVAPEELRVAEKTLIGEYNVCLGINPEGTCYMAAFTKEDIHYFLYGKDCKKSEFEDYLKKILKQ